MKITMLSKRFYIYSKLVVILSLIFFFTLNTKNHASEIISSPDGSIVLTFSISQNPSPYAKSERIYYNVRYHGELVLADSPLGMAFINIPPLAGDFRVYGNQRETKLDTLVPLYRQEKSILQHYNQISIALQEKLPPFRLLQIIFRVSNDGIAFRYSIPKQNEIRNFTIKEELTGFNFTSLDTIYAHPREDYPYPFESRALILPADSLKSRHLFELPLLLKSKDVWIAITEANLRNHSGITLKPSKIFDRSFNVVLSARKNKPDSKVIGETPHHTPWRIILIGNTPGQFIESNFIYLMNEPSVLEDPSWIRPGKALRPWWNGWTTQDSSITDGINTETLLSYLNFAAENHIEYILLDAGWYGDPHHRLEDIKTPIPQLDLKRIIDEGGEKNVGIILGLFWECVSDQMEQAFSLYEEWGVAGISVDGLNRDDQEMVNFCQNVIETAADHHLLVSFHDISKPTGLRRTYPNFLTSEGVLGLEYCKISQLCDPENDVIIPFTRMLAGPMDYSPGCFRVVKQDQFQPAQFLPSAVGTRCHQLAMYVVYDSPLQMCVDYPEAYNDPAFAFIKTVPTVWDETKVIKAQVADYIIMARRHMQDWYIGAMTDWTPRNFYISLDFLPTGKYKASIYMDHADVIRNPAAVLIKEVVIKSSDRLTIPLRPGGGYAAKLTPISKSE